MASRQYLYDNNTTVAKQKQSDSIERWKGNQQMKCKTIKRIKFVLTVDVHSQSEITERNMAWFIFSSALFKIGWQTLPIPLTTVHMIFGNKLCSSICAPDTVEEKLQTEMIRFIICRHQIGPCICFSGAGSANTALVWDGRDLNQT